MHLLTTTLVFGGRFAEAYAVANDLEQAQGRVFQAARRICEASPYLRREATITQSKIEFPETGATITAIGSDYAGAAGTNPVISSFDELWGYTSERSRRLWDEMVPSPVRRISCRLVTTYAAPCETTTSTCLSFATISSGLYLFLGISVLLDAKRHTSSRTTSMRVAQVAGAGVEYAFANNWTAKLEYDYVGLSGSSFTVPGNFVVPALRNDVFSTSNRNVQTVTVGINYLFH
jgi:opacity protein-like surface antigen